MTRKLRRSPKKPDDSPLRCTSAIRRVRVEKLFGLYTYDLKCEASGTEASRLLILYGDNGSGKTTILKLLFNLLTHVDKRGHKTFVAGTRFKRLIIDLGSKIQVVAERRGNNLIGSYVAYVKRNGRIASRFPFTADKDNDIVRGPQFSNRRIYEERLQRFLNALERLNLALFFVTDDRQFLRNVRPAPEEEVAASRFRRVRRTASGGPARELKGRYLDTAVLQATSAAVDWAKEQVLSGSKQGEADANTIYAEIVRRLASVSSEPQKVERTNIRKLIATLEEQAARSEAFAKFGLPFALNITELIRSLYKAKKDLPTIFKIVGPFVDTIRAKLDALQELQDSISGFVATLNSFFKDKTVGFDLKTGVTIWARDGNSLAPANLSSGEKQLLLLFCNTLITKEEETIYLIDEPEISLNIKWQRQLIHSLLESTKKRRVQFILATHSFELFAPHEDCVLQLTDRKNETTKNPAKENHHRVNRHT